MSLFDALFSGVDVPARPTATTIFLDHLVPPPSRRSRVGRRRMAGHRRRTQQLMHDTLHTSTADAPPSGSQRTVGTLHAHSLAARLPHQSRTALRPGYTFCQLWPCGCGSDIFSLHEATKRGSNPKTDPCNLSSRWLLNLASHSENVRPVRTLRSGTLHVHGLAS